MIKETPSLDGVRVTECVPASEIFSGRRRYRFRAAVAVVSFFKKKHNQFKFFYLFIFCSTLPHRHRCLSITPRMSLIFFFVFLSFFLGRHRIVSDRCVEDVVLYDQDTLDSPSSSLGHSKIVRGAGGR